MDRRAFIKGATGMTLAAGGIKALSDVARAKESSVEMPVLFVGHGSPMNAIESNRFSQKWQEVGKQLPKPETILVISAHWLTRGSRVTAMEKPRTIHDFGGFPQELFDAQYPAEGSPEIAKVTQEMLKPAHVTLDDDWGFDHGSWSVLKQMYPDADIPTLQLSIDYDLKPEEHYSLANQLGALRKRGVLILGSGNIVHNLRALKFDGSKFDWAEEFDTKVTDLITRGEDASITKFLEWGSVSKLAHPTYEHFLPLFYALGAKSAEDTPAFFNEGIDLGSISMRSVIYS
jgi:4,5-DOPA dioxygenase extradiol